MKFEPDAVIGQKRALCKGLKECLHILLRGRQPAIICPARGIENMRIPGIWRSAIAEGRVLILSMFPASERRMTAKLSMQRNQIIAVPADEIHFIHISSGGRMAQLFEQTSKLGIPIMGSDITPKLNEAC